MSERAGKRLLAFVFICVGCMLLVICCTGCATSAPLVIGATVAQEEGRVEVELPPGAMLPKEVRVTAGDDEQTYVVPEDVAPFPWEMVVGLLAVGGIACGAALWLGMKPFLPIIGGATAVAITSVVVKLMFWQILMGLLGVVVLAAIVFAFMWFRRSSMLKDLVSGIEKAREADSVLVAGMQKVKVKKSTDKMVDKMRGKK